MSIFMLHWIYHETACWNFFFACSLLRSAISYICSWQSVLRVLWSYWIKQNKKKLKISNNIFTTHSLTPLSCEYLFFAAKHTRKERAPREWTRIAQKKKQNFSAELVAQFKWVHWLSAMRPAFYFPPLSYTRLLTWLARIIKKKRIVYIAR